MQDPIESAAMTDTPKFPSMQDDVDPSKLTPEQREQRKRNEREGGAEDESTDSDADLSVGKDDPTKRGGTREDRAQDGDNAKDRAAQEDHLGKLSPPTPAQGSTR